LYNRVNKLKKKMVIKMVQNISRFISQYSRTPIIQINWDGEPTGYEQNPNKWIFLRKYVALDF